MVNKTHTFSMLVSNDLALCNVVWRTDKQPSEFLSVNGEQYVVVG